MDHNVFHRCHKKQEYKYHNNKPHPILSNMNTIKWFRQRVNLNTIKRSLNYIFHTDNKKPKNDPDKGLSQISIRNKKIRGYLNDISNRNDKFKHIWIKPDYLFSELFMNKINKLKKIFLEFDEDHSRKLDLNEIYEMFHTNGIPVEKQNLKRLFFGDINMPDECLHLNFYQFIDFALGKESDQKFREFMRNVKKSFVQRNNLAEITEEKDDDSYNYIYTECNDFNSIFEEDERISNNTNPNNIERKDFENKESNFLPMNFNLMLNYFNHKQNTRDRKNKIKIAINNMTDKSSQNSKPNKKLVVSELIEDFNYLFNQKAVTDINTPSNEEKDEQNLKSKTISLASSLPNLNFKNKKIESFNSSVFSTDYRKDMGNIYENKQKIKNFRYDTDNNTLRKNSISSSTNDITINGSKLTSEKIYLPSLNKANKFVNKGILKIPNDSARISNNLISSKY